MIEITWIIVPLAIFILLAGIFATIVIRMNTIPNWKKVGKILCWIIGILLFKLLIWGIICQHRNKATTENNQKLITQAIEAKTPKYEWYWKLPNGVYIYGINENPLDGRVAEAIPRNNSSVWADVPYFNQGKPEVERIRLAKSGNKTWEGTWEQDNPEDSAKVFVINVAPDVYAGTITFKRGAKGICYLKKVP